MDLNDSNFNDKYRAVPEILAIIAEQIPKDFGEIVEIEPEPLTNTYRIGFPGIASFCIDFAAFVCISAERRRELILWSIRACHMHEKCTAHMTHQAMQRINAASDEYQDILAAQDLMP